MSDQRYVFLIGAARSGTKFLRDTLAVSTDVSAVPYDINYVWRHGNESCPHDELEPSDIDDATAAHIRKTIVRLAHKDDPSKPAIILEKTVGNCLRVDTVRRVFPEAEFIYLERDGLNVVESSFRQWTRPPDRSYLIKKLRYFPVREWRYALWFVRNQVSRSAADPIWGPRYEHIVEDLARVGTVQTCALQWAKSVTLARSSMNEGDTIVAKYEELDSDREGMARLVEHLRLNDPETVLDHFDRRFKKVDSWPGDLPVTELDAVRRIVDDVAI